MSMAHPERQFPTALRNRKGRKRKSGRRRPSGDLTVPEKRVEEWGVMDTDLADAGEQPHRRPVPLLHRTDPRAGSVLGNLLLTGKLGPMDRKGFPSEAAQRLYEAGRRYAVVVGAYRAVIGTPCATAGSGRGYECLGEANCQPRSCTCLQRTEAYNNAVECLFREGQATAVVVSWVAVRDEDCLSVMVPLLRHGLAVLATHFGIGH